MKRSRFTILTFLMVTICFVFSYGQSRQELEKQRQTIIKDIEKTSKALQSTKKSKEKNAKELKSLEDLMVNRNKLINNIKSEVVLNNRKLEENNGTIQKLSENQKKLMRQYAQVLRVNYLKKLANSKWTYLLSSESINNLMLRWRYMNQFKAFAKQKVGEIKLTTEEIVIKNQEIASLKTKNETNLAETSKNVALLKIEQLEKDKVVKKLTAEEKTLNAKLKKRERERENLNSSIERIIIAELSKSSAKEKDDITLIKKKEIDNSDFAKNRGALAWPVSKGKITGRFGNHPHPTLKNIEISNNGIDITLPAPSAVNCIFDGEVSGVTNIPGWNNVVMIKHGSYTTIYAKLKSVNVSKGQKIKRGQSIGSVAANEDNAVELHFELWKDKVKLNPQNWFNN